MIEKNDILRLTFHGLNIYAHILGSYYPDGILLHLVKYDCKPARNPFNGDKETLLITQDQEMFYYQDAEFEGFRGDVFDFAALHYELQGEELLETINQELNLHLGASTNFYEPYVGQEPIPLEEVAMPHFSFFYSPISNTIPYVSVTPIEVFKAISGKRYKPRTERLRSITDPVEAAHFKRTAFDYVTFGGMFSKRGEKYLEHASGLMVFDFDKVNDLPQLRKILINEPLFETVLLFKSPSGTGLKWIISVDLKQCSHESWFNAVADYLDTSLNIQVDRSGKDVSRACFLCHDPDAYLHPKYNS